MATKNLNNILDLLVRNAYQFLEWKLMHAIGQEKELPEGYFNFDHEFLNEVIRKMDPLLSAALHARKMEAETSKDIVKLLSKGKVSLDEATKLMMLARTKLEVEEKETKKEFQKKMLDLLNEPID